MLPLLSQANPTLSQTTLVTTCQDNLTTGDMMGYLCLSAPQHNVGKMGEVVDLVGRLALASLPLGVVPAGR